MRPLKFKISHFMLMIFICFSVSFTHIKVSYADVSKIINKAIPLFIKKDYKNARKLFLKVLKEEPNNIVARYYIAEIMFTDVRKYDKAAKQFEFVLKLSKRIKSKRFRIRNQYIFNNSMLKLGLVYLKNGQNKKAISYIMTFLKNDEDSAARITAYNSLAVAYSNLDDYENAILYFQEALLLDKDNLLARFNLSAINNKLIYYNTGSSLSIKGRHIEAAREFVKALDIDPYFVAAHFKLGLEHKFLRNYVDAQNELLRAYAINPDYSLNYRILEEIADISLHLGEVDKARKYIEKSLALNDKFPYTYNVIGKINMHDKDYQQAIQNFKKASDMRYVPEFVENLKKAQDALINSVQ